MVRKIGIYAAVLCLAAGAVQAADMDQDRKPGPSISAWLKGLQRKMEQIVPRKSIAPSTGVAGVRGAKEDSRTTLYWKGKKTEEAVSEEELKEFEEGVAFASKGDKANAVRELEEFMKQYPDSSLIPDAKKTLDLVKLEPDVKPAAEGADAGSTAAAKEPAAEAKGPAGKPAAEGTTTPPAVP